MSVAKNIEFKAYYDDIAKARGKCKSMGARMVKTYAQRDIYFPVSRGRLKLRINDGLNHYLIYYNRMNSANIRESAIIKIEIAPNVSDLQYLLKESLGISVEIHKRREVFETEDALINIDDVENLGKFIEIEVMTNKIRPNRNAFIVAKELQDAFDITQANIVPFSYSDLMLMKESSRHWREKLNSSIFHGNLYLIDGVSCSGKTSITHALLNDKELNLSFIPRYTTREKRQNETTESEYIFVSYKEFNELISEGAFIEYRDFEFGMSYGITWEKAINPLLAGHNALGIVNLGNIRHIKNIFPEAITILIDSPIDTIRKRLTARGYHTEEQIEERLENARSVSYYNSYYDHVINNEDGLLQQSLAVVRDLMLKQGKEK